MQTALVITLGVFTGPLFDAGYLRPLLLVGCILIVLGMAMLSLATTYWQIFLAQALCVGLGSGLIYVPSLALVSTLFPPSTRPWAIGCTNGGGSVGGTIFVFMLRRLEPTIGFAWAVRAIALVSLVLAVAALAIILPYRPQKAERRRAMLDLRAFCEPDFMLFTLGLLFNYVMFYFPPFYVPTYATTKLHESQDFAFDCLVLVSAGSFTGRTLPMLFAGRLGSMQVYLAATVGAVVVVFSWLAVHTAAGLVVFSIFYGLVSGVMVAGPSAAISHPTLSPSMSVIGTRMGTTWMFGGIGVLIGSPVAGALVNTHTGNFVRGQIFAGVMVAVGTLCLILPLVSVLRYNRKNKT